MANSRECLTIRVRRRLNSADIIDALTDLFILRDIPAFIRSDNGPKFIALAVRDWIGAVGAKTAYIEPGSPWENGYCESFNARFRDEIAERGNLLQPPRGTDPDRAMEDALQHETTAQRIELSPTSPGNHRPDGPKARHALTFKIDHSGGADQMALNRTGFGVRSCSPDITLDSQDESPQPICATEPVPCESEPRLAQNTATDPC